jgi:hypothetical protein
MLLHHYALRRVHKAYLIPMAEPNQIIKNLQRKGAETIIRATPDGQTVCRYLVSPSAHSSFFYRDCHLHRLLG